MRFHENVHKKKIIWIYFFKNRLSFKVTLKKKLGER